MKQRHRIIQEPEYKTIVFCSISCILTMINLSHIASSIMAVWHAYYVNSQFKEALTFLIVVYHFLQTLLFFASIIYLKCYKRFTEINKLQKVI